MSIHSKRLPSNLVSRKGGTVFSLMIPDFSVPEIPFLPGTHTVEVLGRKYDLGPWTIKPFGALVALGVYVGMIITTRIGAARGLPRHAVARFLYWVLVCAFVGGHVLDVAFYHPSLIIHDPLSLLRLWDGLSSFGGFIGALIGVLAFKKYYKVKNVLPFVETMGTAFPVGWAFGRLGCAVVHDHPGITTHTWFDVAFKDGPRLDLGLCEMAFATLIAIVCMGLARKPRPPGFVLGFTMLSYAPVRFALDFLRIDYTRSVYADPRYLELTPAQWGSIAMGIAGFVFLWKACNSPEVGNEPYVKAATEADPSLLGIDNQQPTTTK